MTMLFAPEHLLLYLDAESLIANAGSNVPSWADESGNGHTATSTGSGQPVISVVDGVRAVQFDGVNDWMAVAGAVPMSDNCTVIAVFATDNNHRRQTLIGRNNAAGAFQLEMGLVQSRQFASPNRGTIISGVAISNVTALDSRDGKLEILVYTRSAAGHRFRQNGYDLPLMGANSTVSYSGQGAIEIGRRTATSQLFGGRLAATLVYDTALDDSTLIEIEEYLADRHGVDTTVGRPYGAVLQSTSPAAGNQGVAYSDGTFFTSESLKLRRFTEAGGVYTNTLERAVTADAPTDKTQVNGLHVVGASLWCGANNYSQTPKKGWAVEYDAATLTPLSSRQIAANYTEGVCRHDFGSGAKWWAVFDDLPAVRAYDDTWMQVAEYPLWFCQGQWEAVYQGVTAFDDLLLCHTHNNNASPELHIYRWNGTGFTPLQRISAIAPGLGQGIAWEIPGQRLLMYNRGTASIVRADLVPVDYGPPVIPDTPTGGAAERRYVRVTWTSPTTGTMEIARRCDLEDWSTIGEVAASAMEWLDVTTTTTMAPEYRLRVRVGEVSSEYTAGFAVTTC